MRTLRLCGKNAGIAEHDIQPDKPHRSNRHYLKPEFTFIRPFRQLSGNIPGITQSHMTCTAQQAQIDYEQHTIQTRTYT
jgi:hypothetical protein